jgi:FtsP/CotA-like multicopper oxidase with cupredoxin domain
VPGDCALVLRSESDLRLATFKIEGEPLAEKPAFAGLPMNPALPNAIALEKASRADLVIEPAALGKEAAKTEAVPGWTINGVAGSLQAKPLVSVKRGTAISFGFINKTSVLQPIHVHGHVMRQLHLLDDGWEPYWRDSVIVPPGKTVRVAFVADNPGRWLVESALPDWSGAGLWGWFEVK